jgi:hypothetical protein
MPRTNATPHARREHRVLAPGLLPAAPARVTEDVHVGREERQALVPPGPAPLSRRVVLGARLVRDRLGHAPHERVVERRGQGDGLREDGGRARARHAVQGLAPPVVGGHAEARDGGRVGDELAHLLLERHAPDEIGHALLERTRRVPVRRVAPPPIRPPCARTSRPRAPRKSENPLSPALTSTVSAALA